MKLQNTETTNKLNTDSQTKNTRAIHSGATWITRMLEAWQQQGTRWLPEYPSGSAGPVEADRLIQQDGRTWRPV